MKDTDNFQRRPTKRDKEKEKHKKYGRYSSRCIRIKEGNLLTKQK